MRNNNIRTIKGFTKYQKELNPNKKQIEKIITINSLEEFISKIKETKLDKEGYVRYYRGERKNYGCIKAGIFRDGNKNICEHEIYNDIINKRPEEFDNCKTTFEHLVKMQHYGAPTRLLDITSNPLVALFLRVTLLRRKKKKKQKNLLSILWI